MNNWRFRLSPKLVKCLLRCKSNYINVKIKTIILKSSLILTQVIICFRYYEFDDVVIRELLGKKITSKSRKDMDEVAEKTGITLKSCRRQYDNVKRVFKVVEDLPGSLAANIKQHFLLSDDLAKYA